MRERFHFLTTLFLTTFFFSVSIISYPSPLFPRSCKFLFYSFLCPTLISPLFTIMLRLSLLMSLFPSSLKSSLRAFYFLFLSLCPPLHSQRAPCIHSTSSSSLLFLSLCPLLPRRASTLPLLYSLSLSVSGPGVSLVCPPSGPGPLSAGRMSTGAAQNCSELLIRINSAPRLVQTSRRPAVYVMIHADFCWGS